MKQKCDYCEGVTLDDMRGHCKACGAPRHKVIGYKWPATAITPEMYEDANCASKYYATYFGVPITTEQYFELSRSRVVYADLDYRVAL